MHIIQTQNCGFQCLFGWALATRLSCVNVVEYPSKKSSWNCVGKSKILAHFDVERSGDCRAEAPTPVIFSGIVAVRCRPVEFVSVTVALKLVTQSQNMLQVSTDSSLPDLKCKCRVNWIPFPVSFVLIKVSELKAPNSPVQIIAVSEKSGLLNTKTSYIFGKWMSFI